MRFTTLFGRSAFFPSKVAKIGPAVGLPHRIRCASSSVCNGAITGTYLYDHQGRRIQRIEGTNALNYLYDGKNIYEEYLTSSWSTPNALYVQAGTDHPLARLIGIVGSPTATAAYYHQDGLGSVLATTSGSKSVSATQRLQTCSA